MRNQNHARQGDVAMSKAITKYDISKLKEVKSLVPNRVVLAYGEVTGHHHSIALDRYNGVKLYTLDEVTALLDIPETYVDGVEVEHQEHGAVILFPGQHEVHIQVEYDPEGERRVQD